MGCDIHAMFQAKEDGEWMDVEHKFGCDRSYMLFSWLADVRNRYDIKPIVDQRGIPDDFVVDDEMEHPVSCEEVMPEWYRKWFEDDKGYWIGDHSFSWLLSSEILSAPDQHVIDSGVIDIDTYREWDGTTCPQSFSQGVFGLRVVMAEEEDDISPDTTHVRISWPVHIQDRLSWFMDEIKRLHELHGCVRMVFGFDN